MAFMYILLLVLRLFTFSPDFDPNSIFQAFFGGGGPGGFTFNFGGPGRMKCFYISTG